MALTLRNKRITKLFRLVSGEERSGLMSRQSPIRRRIRAAVVLSRLLAGRNQVIKLRKSIREIESAAKAVFEEGRLPATEVQAISKLAAIAYAQLLEADRNRMARTRKLTEDEEQKLLASARRPFDLLVQCPNDKCNKIVFDLKTRGFAWRKKLVEGRVVWQLISPIAFDVVPRRNFDEEQRLDVGRGATDSDSTPASTATTHE